MLSGTVHELGTAEYEKFIPPEKLQVGSRAVIVLDVHKVSTVSLVVSDRRFRMAEGLYSRAGTRSRFSSFRAIE